MSDDQGTETADQQEGGEELDQGDQGTAEQETGDREQSQSVTGDGEIKHGDTFPRSYVERLRTEARERREERDQLAERQGAMADMLWASIVAATGRLADPADCPRPDDLEPDQFGQAAGEQIDAILAARPHLAARRAVSIPGQGDHDGGADTLDLAGMLRSRA